MKHGGERRGFCWTSEPACPAVQVPPDNALDERFDLNKFQGRWYITAGLNPLFDIFPCQEHYFGVPKEGVAQTRSIAVP